MINKRTWHVLAACLFLAQSVFAAEMYAVRSDEKGASIISVETSKPVTDSETAVVFRLISTVRLSPNIDIPTVVTRYLLTALCDNKTKHIGGGNIVLKHSLDIRKEIIGKSEEQIQRESYSPPQPLEATFKIGYEAANIACSKMN
jgi:hypothetical protein